MFISSKTLTSLKLYRLKHNVRLLTDRVSFTTLLLVVLVVIPTYRVSFTTTKGSITKGTPSKPRDQ